MLNADLDAKFSAIYMKLGFLIGYCGHARSKAHYHDLSDEELLQLVNTMERETEEVRKVVYDLVGIDLPS